MTTVQIYDARQKRLAPVEKISKSDTEWEKLLTRRQYEITTRKGTETPGSLGKPECPSEVAIFCRQSSR